LRHDADEFVLLFRGEGLEGFETLLRRALAEGFPLFRA
jgi:hypothetical protein